MAATRTQVYLTADQRTRLDELRRRDGRTLAALVRDAIDSYLEDVQPDVAEALRETAGALPDLQVPGRGEWDRSGG